MEVSFKKHTTELGYVLFKNTYVFILRKSSSIANPFEKCSNRNSL